jgi:hypothetical protein
MSTNPWMHVFSPAKTETAGGNPTDSDRNMNTAHRGSVRLEPYGGSSGKSSILWGPARTIEATLLHCGPEGIGVKVSQDAAARLFAFVQYRCELIHPFFHKPAWVVARVTHGRPTLDGGFYVGLEFQFFQPARARLATE